MTEYILAAAGAIFLSVVVGLIIPEGRLKKAVSFVVRIACICLLVSPVLTIFDVDIKSDGGQGADYEYISEMYSLTQSRELEGMLEERFGCDMAADVEIVYEDGAFREKGVKIVTDKVEEALIDDIVSYLKELGYININVNEKVYRGAQGQ